MEVLQMKSDYKSQLVLVNMSRLVLNLVYKH